MTETSVQTAKSGERSPERLLEQHFLETLRAALAELDTRAHSFGEDELLERAVSRVREVRGLRQALDVLVQRRAAVEETAIIYLCSTRFLVAAHRVLTRTREEGLVYATGPEYGDHVCALTRLVAVDLMDRSVAHAAPEPSSQVRAFTELDARGERLLAVLHSHPGDGPGATTPSSVDLGTQGGLERAGYPAIGAVFSRDGYIRFFSADRRFRVVVSGTGHVRLDDRLVELTGVDSGFVVRKGGTRERAKINLGR